MSPMPFHVDLSPSSWRGAVAAALICLAPSVLAAPASLPELKYPRLPDLKSVNSEGVRKLAAELNRSCVARSAVGWSSARPKDELHQLATSVMQGQQAFTGINESPSFPERPADNSARLYLAESRAGGAPFTFLWRAEKSHVSLQICGGEPPAEANPDFPRCAKSVGPAVGVLGANCPPTSSM